LFLNFKTYSPKISLLIFRFQFNCKFVILSCY
jgi:hypothetical protein